MGDTGGMNPFRIASSLLVSALFVLACGDDGAGTDTETTTLTSTMTDPGPTMAGTDSTVDPTEDPPTTTDPTGGSAAMYCAESCAADGDCKLMGMELGYTCNAGTCENKCASDATCQATYSGWTACVAQADCIIPGQVCVDIGGGVGKCASPPSDVVPCATLMQSEVMFPTLEGGMQTTVCANTNFTCNDDGACENPCELDTDCMLVPGTPSCNVGTGKCECGSNADCEATMVAGANVCDAGVCGCAADADCVDAAGGTRCSDNGVCGCAADSECTFPNADKCYDGACGCTDSASCTQPVFDGTTQECKGL